MPSCSLVFAAILIVQVIFFVWILHSLKTKIVWIGSSVQDLLDFSRFVWVRVWHSNSIQFGVLERASFVL